jgi:FdhE protein
MKENDGGAKRFKGIAEREIEKHPHSRELIEAFLPLVAARAHFLESDKSANAEPLVCDGVRFPAGVPLIGQQNLFYRDDPWEAMALTVVSAMKEGFPGLRDDLERLASAIRDGRLSPYDYFRDASDGGERVIGAWAAKLGVAIPRVEFVLDQIKRMVLRRRRRDFGETVPAAHWKKGYCPICGAFPSLARIQEKGGQLRLHCSQCGHDWPFSRVICPYCEHEGQEGMNFFFVEDNEVESAFVCDQCKRYLITLNHVTEWIDRDPDLSAIALAHLDIMMQERGFSPMTDCGWNVFPKEP